MYALQIDGQFLRNLNQNPSKIFYETFQVGLKIYKQEQAKNGPDAQMVLKKR